MAEIYQQDIDYIETTKEFMYMSMMKLDLCQNQNSNLKDIDVFIN